jgi:hypothetical protein
MGKNKEFYIIAVVDIGESIIRFFGKSGDGMGYLSHYTKEAMKFKNKDEALEAAKYFIQPIIDNGEVNYSFMVLKFNYEYDFIFKNTKGWTIDIIKGAR